MNRFVEAYLKSEANSSPRRRFRAEKIPELNCFGKIVHFVAVFPINPDIFDAHVTVVMGFLQRTENSSVIDGVLLEGCLQAAFPRAAGMEVGGMRDQRFNGAVRKSAAGEVRVVECQCQAGHPVHQTQRLFRFRNDRTYVGLDADTIR